MGRQFWYPPSRLDTGKIAAVIEKRGVVHNLCTRSENILHI